MLPVRTLLLISMVAAAFAQSPAPPPGIYRVGGGVSAPVLLSKQEPLYTDEARQAKLQGAVTLYVVIDEQGNATQMRVVKSLGLGLDETALTAVSAWRFAPGRKDGVPVAVQATIEVNFRLLLKPDEWLMNGLSFVAPPGATQPTLIKAAYPKGNGSDDYATVRLSFDIDQEGRPRNIQVDSASDHRFDDQVIAMLQEWRFQSALDHGVAVESKGYVDLTRGIDTNVVPPGAAPRKKQ